MSPTECLSKMLIHDLSLVLLICITFWRIQQATKRWLFFLVDGVLHFMRAVSIGDGKYVITHLLFYGDGKDIHGCCLLWVLLEKQIQSTMMTISFENSSCQRGFHAVQLCSLFLKRRYHIKKGKRKVQGVPQSETAALPRHQEEEETEKSKQIEQTYEKHKD